MATKTVLLRLGQAVDTTVRCSRDISTCEDCHARKMAGYRPDVLTDPAYWTDEPIDDD
jgi:hypothetical protein